VLADDLTPAERLHLAAALRDYGRDLRRNGRRLPERLERLADALPCMNDTAQKFGIPGVASDDESGSSIHLCAAEAAARAGCSGATLRRAAASGRLAAKRIGRRAWAVHPLDLEAWMMKRRAAR
jgi:hypothetical protein